MELEPITAAGLRAKGYAVHEGDSLAFTPDSPNHAIVLNPAVRRRGSAAVRAFRDFVCDYGSSETMEAGTFAESGAKVETAPLNLEKTPTDSLRHPVEG